jgi:hypothetical protein
MRRLSLPLSSALGAGEQSAMETPDWVTNEASWRKTCKKVVARAKDLQECRIGVIACAIEMSKLAIWLRNKSDPDFILFETISSESIELPVGQVRQYLSEDALRREDLKIEEFENRWRKIAIEAASSLRNKYESSTNST